MSNDTSSRTGAVRRTAPVSGVDDATLVTRFRTSLLLLAAGTAVGTALELVTIRHWEDLSQIVPWLILLVLVIGIIWQWVAPSVRSVLAARLLALVSVAGSGIGIILHIRSNHETAPLSLEWSDKWDRLSASEQWWQAATGGAGPSPSLAPGFLALTGICLALATLGMTTRQRSGSGSSH